MNKKDRIDRIRKELLEQRRRYLMLSTELQRATGCPVISNLRSDEYGREA